MVLCKECHHGRKPDEPELAGFVGCAAQQRSTMERARVYSAIFLRSCTLFEPFGGKPKVSSRRATPESGPASAPQSTLDILELAEMF